MLHGHGNDIFNAKHPVKADFSSNVVPTGMHPELTAHLMASIHSAANYPESDSTTLCKAIANVENIKPENIVVTNGSTEAFYLTAQLFGNSSSVITIPSFSEYEDAAKSHRHQLSFLPLNHLHKSYKTTAKCLWLGNPNNPDGSITASETILSVCHGNPESVVIVDEAYTHLCNSHDALLKLCPLPANLIVIRSLTKAFAIPGLRLGYMVAHRIICEKIRKIKMPWSVNCLAQQAGLFIVQNHQMLLPSTQALVAESLRLQKALAHLPDIEVTPSECNYFLGRLKKRTAAQLKETLLQNHGFLIRDASNFRGLQSGHFRIAANTPEQNNHLINAIQSWLLT